MTAKTDPLWGPSPHPLITVEEAWEIIGGEVMPLEAETVRFEHTAGRVLAAPLHAAEDYPPFNRAMMDGFAVRAADCAATGTVLDVLGLAAAGYDAKLVVAQDQAVQVNTGAPVPDGADTVVRIEDTTFASGDAHVTINISVTPGKHIALQGCNRRRGDLLLAPPLRIEPAACAAVATAGAASLQVYPDVETAVVTTGDELVPVGQERRAGQIHNSNGPMLGALCRQFGAVARESGIVRDNKPDIRQAMTDALQAPIVVASGGMSMGTHDLVPGVLAELGVTWRFHGVRVRPGKPIAYGRGPDGQHVFGLPGNPASAFVCAWLFVRMAIRGLQGFPVLPPHRLQATLTKDVPPARDGRPAFSPARVWNRAEQGLVAEPCRWGGSADPFGPALANALLVREEPTRLLAAGTPAEIIYVSSEI